MTVTNRDLRKKGQLWLKSFVLIILLVVFSVLHKAGKYGLVLFDHTLPVYIFIWIGFLLIVLLLLGRWILPKYDAGIFISLYVGLFLLNYGEIQDFLLNNIKSKLLASNWLLLAVFFLLLIIGLGIYKKRLFLKTKTYYFLLSLFTLFTLVEVFRIFTSKKEIFYDIAGVQPKIRESTISSDAKPDIYYLIFDSYTSPSALTTYWNFSNDSLVSFLKQKNFKVSHSAQSAYDFTPISLNSTFNLNYLPLSKQAFAHDFVNFNYGKKIFDESFTIRWFKIQGYRVDCYSLMSLAYNLNLFYPFAPDKPLHWLRRQTVERIWLTPLVWNRVLSLFGINKEYPDQVRDALHTFMQYNQSLLDSVQGISSNSDPRFVYAHFFLPHGPYIYKQDGTERPLAETLESDMQKQKAFYLDHIVYANSYIRQIVSGLLNSGKKNKVIIIQGDHGYRDYLFNEPGDKRAIFNAVYFDDGNYSQVSDSMLSVNTFRIILNKYFNQELPLLNQQVHR